MFEAKDNEDRSCSNYMSKLKISSVFLMSQCSEDEVQCISCTCMIGDLEHRISSHFVG